MSQGEANPAVPVQRSMGCLVASIQVDLSAEVINKLADSLLQELHRGGANGVILDLSGLSIMDAEEFSALRKIERMASLMGAHTLYAGFKPGVVSALIDLEADISSINAARNLDEAFELVASITASEQADPTSQDSNNAE